MTESHQPLAARMRPKSLADFAGQPHLLGEDKALARAILSGELHSMILWGPPGTGKTTLAKMISAYAKADFFTLSAVLSGVKDIRAVIEAAKQKLAQGVRSILFVDEVHRFNKAQQDVFLPHIEDGTITFIGATTENPSFELNNALLSRVRVYVLKALTTDDIDVVIERALQDTDVGLGKLKIAFEQNTRNQLIEIADGDARRALNILEILVDLADEKDHQILITEALAKTVFSGQVKAFDKGGDIFYEQISALHKSVRGSDPDAALYWLCRMLDGGCDPLYIARRVVRMASEDIGNADTRALSLALDAWQTYERLGSPEGELAIAHAVVYLAAVPKSNAVYTAYHSAMKFVKSTGNLDVPLHLRNAPTQFMKTIGYGKDYRYAHDEANAYAAGEQYFPGEIDAQSFYQPTEHGLEAKIKQRLAWLKSL